MPFLTSIETPIVVANIDDSAEPDFQGKYNKSIILEREGRKIGVIGVVATTTSVRVIKTSAEKHKIKNTRFVNKNKKILATDKIYTQK